MSRSNLFLRRAFSVSFARGIPFTSVLLNPFHSFTAVPWSWSTICLHLNYSQSIFQAKRRAATNITHSIASQFVLISLFYLPDQVAILHLQRVYSELLPGIFRIKPKQCGSRPLFS